MIHTKSGQWPRAIDARSAEELKKDSEILYIVIPVKHTFGNNIQSRLPDKSNFEEKINVFLILPGLEHTFVTINVEKTS